MIMGSKSNYTISDFCQLAGFSRQHLYEAYWKKGLGPARVIVQFGRAKRIEIPADEADLWLARYWLKKDRRGRKVAITHKPTQERIEHGNYQHAA